jgi:hypothetical protein
MLNIRTLISTVAIVFWLILAAGSMATTTDAAAGFVSNTDIVLDECFDVSISELADCRRGNQRLAQSYRHRLDECFDVSLREVADCRRGNQRLAQSYRPRLDECFDVPLRERTACRQTTTAFSR